MINSIAQSITVVTLDHMIIVYIFLLSFNVFVYNNFLLWRHMLLIHYVVKYRT